MATKYLFEKTELRVMHSLYPDEEAFLDIVSDLIGKLTEDCDMYKIAAETAESKIRELNN